MKAKIALTLSLLVLFSITSFAQKQSSSLKSANIPSTLQELENLYSGNPLKIMRDNPDWEMSEEAITRLNAAMVNQTFAEKLDSTHEYTYSPDSIGWEMLSKEFYEFDALGRNYNYWTETYFVQIGDFIQENMIEVDWNSNYQITGIRQYQWNGEGWDLRDESVYEFDKQGRLITTTNSAWDEYFYEVTLSSTDTTYYGGLGLVSKHVSYRWDNFFYYWVPQSKQEFVYQPDGLLREMTDYYWEGDTVGSWIENGLSVYHYDEMGRDTAIYGYYWGGATWYDSYRQIKKFDGKDRLVEDANYYWSGEMQWWEGNNKTEYVFDANNHLFETIDSYWDWYTQDWYISGKTEKIWDDLGNLIEEIEFSYDTSLLQYDSIWKQNWNYDTRISMEDVAMPYFWKGELLMNSEMQGMFQNKVTSTIDFSWNPQMLRWDPVDSDTLFYSSLFDEPVNEANCKADFDWSPGKDIQEVSFTDLSGVDVVARYWIFGDGKTSTRQNPVHTYARAGTYKVILTTIDEHGFCSNTMVKQIKVGAPSCNAAFSYLSDTVKQVLVLLDESQGTDLKYFWSFGDGSVSKAANPPTHTFKYPGTYPVVLTVSNGTGDCMDLYSAKIKVGSNPCKTDFAVYIDSSSNTVLFRAREVNPQNVYRWVFGDGTGGYGSNRNHTFSDPGYYSASLTVSNVLAGCVETHKESLLVGNQGKGVKAGFIYVSGDENTVKFTNQSSELTPLTYHWDFNDSETSEEKDPEHNYVLAGYYDVCLTVTSKDGLQNTYCEKIFAGNETQDNCLAKFEYSFSEEDDLKIILKDRSFGEPDKWDWEFPDKNDTLQDPDWTAGEPGFYKIGQTVTNSKNGCVDHAFGIINMGAKSSLHAAFGYIPGQVNSKAETYPVDFIGVSLGDAGKLKWDFGDGTYDSTSINPVHYYDIPGQYDVCLTITNGSTGDTAISCETIWVGQTSREDLPAEELGLISYPNPFSQTAQIEIRLLTNSEIDLSVYDLVGRKVKTIANENRVAGNHTFTLDGSGLEEGNYYLILDTASGRSGHMISIMR